MANDCPSRSSTSVSARRVVSAGIRNPSSVMPLAKSSALTSGRTFRRITIAGNRRLEVQPDAELLEDDGDRAASSPWAIGTGNSPPARKLASWPL